METQVETVQREWMSYPDAERYSGLSRVTLWRAMRAGELRAARIGRAVRISREALDEYMEQHVTV